MSAKVINGVAKLSCMKQQHRERGRSMICARNFDRPNVHSHGFKGSATLDLSHLTQVRGLLSDKVAP